MAVGSFIGRRAIESLTPEQKQAVLGSALKVNWYLIALVLFIGGEIWIATILRDEPWMMPAFFISLFLAVVLFFARMHLRFRKLNLPARFIKTQVALHIATVVCLAFMFWSAYKIYRDVNVRSAELQEKAHAIRDRM